ncbi:MAG: phosphoenolpyruvate--protein phosphotransferase, partial [Mycoplasmataceae bacterium]|nr:phosphoenolpyruvate--protein phosphotransferase [Mycoplasmataceae bacterium]
MKLKGIGASTGISVAKVFKLEEIEVKITNAKGEPQEEIKKVKDAIEKAKKGIEAIKKVALVNLGPEEAAIFDAHIQVASDPAMFDDIKKLIETEKYNAIYATNEVTSNYITMFSSMEDEYMKERAADIKDVAKRIINAIAGIKTVNLSAIDEEVIIVAEDLTPSDTAQLNKKYVKGFATNIGGRTSHSAIMARSLEIPAVLGLKNIMDKVEDDDMLAIDGTTGDVIIKPTKAEESELSKRAEELAKHEAQAKTFIGKKSLTKDGHKVELGGNIGSPNDVAGVVKNDGEAVGLFRSEFLYMDAKDWPTEEEQFKSYKEAISGMSGKLVVVRTLDIGGDKTLSYFKFPVEMNPFLGYRAIRLTLDKKDIFRTQLRALFRASAFGKLAIMFPMIATVNEFKEAKKIAMEEKDKLVKEGIKVADDVQIGMMIEIPSAAVMANQFAKYADFFSIGTNDLMQYTMAADRMNEKVSYLYQPLNPA